MSYVVCERINLRGPIRSLIIEQQVMRRMKNHAKSLASRQNIISPHQVACKKSKSENIDYKHFLCAQYLSYSPQDNMTSRALSIRDKKLQRNLRKPLSFQNRQLFIQQLAEHRASGGTPVQFSRFNELPLELRLRVWNYHLVEPRVVDLYYLEGVKRPVDEEYDTVGYAHWESPLPAPSALSCCKESRGEALKVYSLCFARPETRFKWPNHQYRWTIVPPLLPRIYFSTQDILYVHDFTKPSWAISIADRCKKDVSRVLSLAVNVEDWWNANTGYLRVRDHLGYKLQHFNSLETLTFILIRQHGTTQNLLFSDQIQFTTVKDACGKATKQQEPWRLAKIKVAVERDMQETLTKFPAWNKPVINYAQMNGRFISSI